MEKYIKEAKERADFEAKEFIRELECIASDELQVEGEWFIEEVIKKIRQIKRGEQ